MKYFGATFVFICSVYASSVHADVYTPTDQVSEFAKQFEKAYRAGDRAWVQSAIDKAGVIEEMKASYYASRGPENGGGNISNFEVIAAPNDFKLPSLPSRHFDFQIEPTIPVKYLMIFTLKTSESETTIRIPIGYRDGKIWIVGIQKSMAEQGAAPNP